MGEWQIPTAQPTLAILNTDIIYLLLGLYGWEYVQSLYIEYAVICGRISFRLPLIPYIIGRTCLLVFLVLLAVGTSPFSGGVACQPSVLLTALSANIALGCSSTVFTIRTWVIWKDSRLMHVLLVLLSLGQWSVLMFNVTAVKSIDVNGVCEVYISVPQMNAVALIYTTCYDLLVFVSSVVGLSRQRSESPLKKRLFAQGILYFAVAGIVYIPPAVFALYNSISLLLILSNSAITVSTIMSSRAVRSLLSLDTSEPSQSPGSNIALTTEIVIRPSTTHDGGRPCVDEADSC